MPPFSPPSAPEPYNLNNELAKERSRAAAERTLMAWIRTALSLIGFGFGIDRIVAAVYSSKLSDSDRIDVSVRLLSIGFIAIGNVALLLAVFQHQQVLKRLRRSDFRYDPPLPIATITAISLFMIGVLALLTLISG
jgi:putative membrane protein